MQTAIKRWGNSAALRLPAPMLAALDLSIDSLVDLRMEDDRIVIVPVHEPEYALESLLEASSEAQFSLDDDDRDWLEEGPVGREEPL
jgi:antitoxin MazE